ncbi:YigZ family protein [Sulfurimonas sp.]|uniref:IMPACT family protein n=1 Tax=Sulfurimonas sp. TaxID=2022749 RepID=UPI002601684B|nr:YigZ family protein [Sulfurimonas sp.]
MNFIKEEFATTLEVKQSKFIAHLIPFSQYQSKLVVLKKEHPKARHFVVAYRYLNEYEQIVEYSSDDGEPSGTSGKPSLMVLQGQGLINAAVIVVRYFGGTKLGTGGLVRAYSDALNAVVASAELFEYKKEVMIEVVFDYGAVRLVEYECEKLAINIVEKIFDLQVQYVLKAPKENLDKLCLLSSLNSISHIPHR